MPECHQCKADAGSAPQRGTCSFCGTTAQLCPRCAAFEWGGPPAPAGLPDYLRTPKSAALIARCPGLPPAPPAALDTMDSRCGLINKQLKDPEFAKRAQDGLALFHACYGKTSPFSPTFMQGLILLQLSAEERCKDPDDEFVHRFDAPRVAQKHAETCSLAGNVSPEDAALGQAAAGPGTDIVELVCRDKLCSYSARRRLLELPEVGGDPAKARKVLQMSIMLYHATTGLRTPDARPDGGFNPLGATGYMSKEYKESLYDGGSPPRFSGPVEGRLGALYESIDHSPLPSSGPGSYRFPDPDIDKFRAPEMGGLTEQQARYLQSLPKMDTPSGSAGQGTQCEHVIRGQVAAKLKQLLNTTPEKVPKWKRVLLRKNKWKWSLEGENNRFSDQQIEEILDAMVADLRSGTHLETSTTGGTIQRLASDFTGDRLKSQSEVIVGQQPWSHVFKYPSCSQSGNYQAFSYLQAHHAHVQDGRQKVDHYLSWRNDKDRKLYCCHDFTPEELPKFASLNRHADLPEPNWGYGHNVILWDHDKVFGQSVFTIGDKGTPRRSMTLVLRDLLYEVPDAEGRPGMSNRSRLQHVGMMMQRAQNPGGRTDPAAVTSSQFLAQLTGPLVKRPGGIDVIECHMFGQTKPSQHAKALFVETGTPEVDPHLPALRNAMSTQNDCRLIEFQANPATLGHPVQKGAYPESSRTPIPTPLTDELGMSTWPKSKPADAFKAHEQRLQIISEPIPPPKNNP